MTNMSVTPVVACDSLNGPAGLLKPLGLVRKGLNVVVSKKNGVPCVGSRRFLEISSQGYVLTELLLQIGEIYVVQITGTRPCEVGSLSFGVTSCDPRTILIDELPDDPNQLADRPEYWMLSRNVAEDTKRGDTLMFSITNNGEVLCQKNRNSAVMLMCVDLSRTLWGVFDVYGKTTEIGLYKILMQTPTVPNVVVRSPQQPSTSYETVAPSPQNTVCYAPQQPVVRPNTLEVNADATNGGDTVLSVNLPAAPRTNQIRHPSPARSQNSGHQQQVSARPPSVTIRQPRAVPAVQQSLLPQQSSSGEGECSICLERAVECALYKCGHFCMCYECAINQWVRLGRCPICRAVIDDVIKIYR